jgi:signal transduction histidine kinase
MNGVEFLARAREIDDYCIRILVTAYGDVDILGAAVNDGRIDNYVPKPWEPEKMQLVIRRAIEVYSIDRERRAALKDLSILNHTATNLYKELNLERLGQLVLSIVRRELHFDGVSLALFDRHGEELTWLGMAPDDDVAERIRRIRLSRRTAPRFFEMVLTGITETLELANLADLEGPVRDWLAEVSADEILVAPLNGRSGVIGFLAVDHRCGSGSFVAEDLWMIEGLRTQVAISIDNAHLVDQLRSSREAVKRADRLGTLGTLAAGLAHEINNPLVAVRTFLSLAPKKRHEDDEEFWGSYHELTVSELERIQGLVATMSQLSRGGLDNIVAGEVDLASLAGKISTLTQVEAREAGVELRATFADNVLPVHGVKDHLHQAVLNLVCNAIQATPAGGEVCIHVSVDRDHPRDLMCVTVTDTGVGISPELAEKIFDPFFTTKGPDEGTGLGLMIAHQIVADHGGAIEVRSQVDEGSSFKVKLPVKGAAGR